MLPRVRHGRRKTSPGASYHLGCRGRPSQHPSSEHRRRPRAGARRDCVPGSRASAQERPSRLRRGQGSAGPGPHQPWPAEGFQEALKGDVELYSESLQVSHFKGDGYEDVLREHFRRKYEGTRLDLIVAVMAPSLDFLLRHGPALFPGVPIVFCGVDASDVERRALPGNVTGVLVKRTFAPTLDIALRLQPGTARVYVVSGTSRFDQQIQAIARRDLAPLERRLAMTWLTAQPMDELLRTVAQLPPNSIIYFLGFFADAADRRFIPHEALAQIARLANAPVYLAVDQFVGLGAVGGHVYSVSAHGRQAAEIGVRILRGTAATALPVAALEAHRDVFDWRQLQRWGLDERRLPAGSAVDFRVPSVLESYKWAIVSGGILFILQSTLVVGLLVNRAQRRRAESARQESEQRRRRAEEEVQCQRDELAHALRVATLGELTASLTHEITQPLTAIAANAQAARRMLAAESPKPEVTEALDDVAQDAHRAAETVRRLRALFRKQPAERVPVDVNLLVAEALGVLANDMQRRRIEVSVAPAEGLPLVLGDDVQLRQVVINILLNAADAMVAAGDGRREIRIHTSRADTQAVEIAIRDSGIGIEEDRLERMFEHFISSKPGGLGMGLAISRSIVAAHGGRIWATRNDGRGLTLHVHLPVIADIAGSERPGPRPALAAASACLARGGRTEPP